METLISRQEKIIKELDSLDTELKQFDYFFNKAFLFKEGPRSDKYLIEGCISKAWVKVWSKENKIHMEVESDSLILKGLLVAMKEIYEEASFEEVNNSEFLLMKSIKVVGLLDEHRMESISKILKIVIDETQVSNRRIK